MFIEIKNTNITKINRYIVRIIYLSTLYYKLLFAKIKMTGFDFFRYIYLLFFDKMVSPFKFKDVKYVQFVNNA